MCDENGRSMGNSLYKELSDNWLVQMIIKPGALYKDIIMDVIDLTKYFTLRDYVVIVGGTNDFLLNRGVPLFRNINSKIRYCTHTNIIFTPVSLGKALKNSTRVVKKFNFKLCEYSYRLNKYSEGKVQWCDVNDRWGNREKIDVICNRLMNEILAKKFIDHSKNLVFVPVLANKKENGDGIFLGPDLPVETIN